MKVIVLFGAPFQMGGHFRSAFTMINALSRKGIHFTVIAPPGGDFEIEKEYVEKIDEKDNCSIVIMPELSRFNPYFNWPATCAIIREIRKGADVVHAWDFNSLYPAYLAATMSERGLVFTRAGGPVVKHIPPKNVEIVLFSEELQTGMKARFHIPDENVTLIRARIDMNDFYRGKANLDFLSRYHIPKDAHRIVMAMRLSESKRSWLETMMRLTDCLSTDKKGLTFVIAGDGPLLRELKEKMRLRDLGQQRAEIRFIGPIKDVADMNRLYQCATVVVGHGRGILEAMACGKPVIVLGEDGSGELVTEKTVADIAHYNFSGRHLRYRKSNYTYLGDLIRPLFLNNKLRNTLGDFSHQYIRKEMDAEIGASQLKEVYQRAYTKHSCWKDYMRWHLATILNNVFGHVHGKK